MWPKGLGFWDLGFGFRVLGLVRNNIFLDKAYELSTYLSKIY